MPPKTSILKLLGGGGGNFDACGMDLTASQIQPHAMHGECVPVIWCMRGDETRYSKIPDHVHTCCIATDILLHLPTRNTVQEPMNPATLMG